MSPTLDTNFSIIAEHWTSQIAVTTITWFILVSLFFYRQGHVWTNHDMLNLVRAAPRLLKLVRVGPRMLKLARAGRRLFNLVLADPLIIGSHDSGAAAAATDVATVGDCLVQCGRGADQG